MTVDDDPVDELAERARREVGWRDSYTGELLPPEYVPTPQRPPRRCRWPGCPTMLSAYNADDAYCFAHQDAQTSRVTLPGARAGR